MATITMNLSDELVIKAKQAGVYDEKTLKDTLQQFLQSQILKAAPNNQQTLADYLNNRDLSAVPTEFMRDRQLPMQNRVLFAEQPQ